MKIVTNQKRIPWSWAAIVLFPWFATSMREAITNAGMTFTLKKFYDDPALIGLILSSNYAFGLTVGSLVAFLSDYIWTPWGRRRPFLLISFLGAAALSVFIPASNVGWLTIALIVFYQFVVDFMGSYEPFTMDVIPSEQRGRSGSITHWYKTLGVGVAMAVLIANYDSLYELGSLRFDGETVMYWANALALGASGFLVLFLVKETKPANFQRQPLRKLLVQRFVVELTRPTMLRLMGLALCIQTLWQGLSQFEPLLITEQWGYEKSEYGYLMTASMVVTLCVVPIAGWLSDRFDRLRLLRLGLYVVVILKIGVYVYFEFFITGAPSIAAVFAIGFFKSTIGSFMAVACVPLLFDFVPNSRLGTLGCALGIVFALASFVGTNAMGLWIKFSSPTLFDLPAGTYNYFAGYHWLILCGLLAIWYIHVFERAEKRGLIKRLGKDADAQAG